MQKSWRLEEKTLVGRPPLLLALINLCSTGTCGGRAHSIWLLSDSEGSSAFAYYPRCPCQYLIIICVKASILLRRGGWGHQISECVCGERGGNQKKAKALLLPHFLWPENFIFISKESSKNDLLYNPNLFIHVSSNVSKVRGGNMDCWMGFFEVGERMGSSRMRKVEGGGLTSTEQRKNNGADADIQMSIQLIKMQSVYSEAPPQTPFDVTPLYGHNLWAILQRLRSGGGPCDNDARVSSSSPSQLRTSQWWVFIKKPCGGRKRKGGGGGGWLQITDNGTALMKRMVKCH